MLCYEWPVLYQEPLTVLHYLLLAKLEAYSLDRNTSKLIYSYLTNGKQAVKIKDVVAILKLIIFIVTQESILGPILSNFFINDLFYFTDSENFHNSADDKFIDTI